MIFVSAPYSHADKAVVQERYRRTCLYCAKLMAEGKLAISPVVYGHALVEHSNIAGDWNTWKDFCENILTVCNVMHVLELPGYDKSTGVTEELAKALGADHYIEILFIPEMDIPK